MQTRDVMIAVCHELRKPPGIDCYFVDALDYLHVVNGRDRHFIITYDGRHWNVMRWNDKESFDGGQYPHCTSKLGTSEGEMMVNAIANAIYAYAGF